MSPVDSEAPGPRLRGLVLPGLSFSGIRLGAHSLLVASLALLLGYQSILFAVFSKTFAISAGLMPEDARLTRFFEVVNLERGLMLGGAAFVCGVALLAATALEWRSLSFGDLDYERAMRRVIPGVTLTALGFQTLLSSFFVSILGMGRR